MRRVKILLKEVRIHGRGGQGVVTTAQLLAYAAFIEGKHVQEFPFYGAERRGAPIRAFVRISDSPILMHSQIYYPKYVIVLDPQIHSIIDVTQGFRRTE
jgi:2-oxoacid:acceptor oxidoreductase gamma subunit (pyruvate/2-ketoisovalerate family)